MYGVKREVGEEICRGCFSTDRRLSPLANYNLFFALLDDKYKLEALKLPTVQLCWECNAMLHRITVFQTRVQLAQTLLQEVMESEGQLPTRGLSQLSTSSKQDYDVVFEDELDNAEEEFIIPIKEEIKFQTDVFNHNLNSDNDHYFEDTDILETHDELDLFVETTEHSLVETIPHKTYKRKLKTKGSLETKIKRNKVVTVPIKKGNRPGLRSSREIVCPLYPNRKNRNKTDPKKTKIKVGKTLKREYKQSTRKRCLNRKNESQKFIVEKGKQMLDGGNTPAKDLQNEVIYDDKTVKRDDLEIGHVDSEDVKEKLEDSHCIEEKSDLDGTDSESDVNEDDDPDFEEKCTKNSSKTIKNKQKGVATRDKWLHCICVRFNVVDELDEYFTKVDLSPEELKHILDNELSYGNEDQPHSCNYCGTCFQKRKTLIIHKRTRHKQMAKCTNPVYLMYRCNICHKIVRKEHTEAHMKYLHRWRYSCKECDKDFWDMGEGKIHFMECHKQKHSCSVCHYTSWSKMCMDRHMRHRHTPVSCDVCGKRVAGANYLRLHRRRHELDASAPELRYCVPCDKQFQSLYTYEQHVKYSAVHSGKTPEKIPCTECGKLLRDKRSFQDHYDCYHSDRTRFQCPQCDKYYSRKSSLQAHIDTAHLKKKLPKDKLCTICGRGFSFLRTLKFHVRTHTGERPHVCPHCPAAFAQPFPLRKHLATQHGEAPAPKKKMAPTTQNKVAPTTQA